jgi:nitronate monooxygenase
MQRRANLARLPFRLRLPVVAAPMFLVSGPDLVIAACRAGIMGAFPTTNARTVEELDVWMTRIAEAVPHSPHADSSSPLVGPWCANLITHSTNTRLTRDLELIARHRPPVVITALGSPKPAIEIVHAYGGLVIADVIDLVLARKAVAAGADGLACIAAGAGGHTGWLSPFAFVSAVRRFFDGLLIVGGGIADGQGVAGAVAAGADLIYMGTRFIPTRESLAADAYKQMIVDADIGELVVSAALTGSPASWLKPSLRAAGMDPENLPARPARNYDSSDTGPKRWRDVWSAGQGLGSIEAVEPVASVVQRLEGEYWAALRRAGAHLPATPGPA